MTKPRILSLLLSLTILAGCAPGAKVAAPTERNTPEATAPAPANGAPLNWYLLDETADRFPGISMDKALRTLLAGKKPQKTVVVAVIDSGVDIAHEDLAGRIWTNEDEVPSNGVDDDRNGYVDDIHGWNFIGGPDGRNVARDSYELTREYARLKARFGDTPADQVAAADREDYAYWQRIKAAYEARLQELGTMYANLSQVNDAAQRADRVLKQHFGTDTLTEAQVRGLRPTGEDLQAARNIMLYLMEHGYSVEMVREQKEHLQGMLENGMDPAFDPRGIVGDNYADVTERFYGNNDVTGPDAKHGTHVAGIIAANPDNNLGAVGIAPNVRIMAVRTVPDGDERDKDVANAIRYAVENGADIINMSFGKSYSPQKAAVDAAVRYADEQGVLLIHGAGNDGKDVDTADNYPSRLYSDGARARHWIEVGASSWQPGAGLAAEFSNYGRATVDVFAPGVDIYSTVPGNQYESLDGTSMAAPVVSGLAALLMSYYPNLSAEQVRTILLDSAVRVSNQVDIPGEDTTLVDFARLSTTGGIVNLYEAIRMAEEMSR